MTSLEDIASVLEEMQYQVTVDQETRVQAKDSLDKMLEFSN